MTATKPDLEEDWADLRACRPPRDSEPPPPEAPPEDCFWVGLLDDSLIEAAWPGYARIKLPPVGEPLAFPAATAPFTVSFLAAFKTPEGGELVFRTRLPRQFPMLAGDTLHIPVWSLTISLEMNNGQPAIQVPIQDFLRGRLPWAPTRA